MITQWSYLSYDLLRALNILIITYSSYEKVQNSLLYVLIIYFKTVSLHFK